SVGKASDRIYRRGGCRIFHQHVTPTISLPVPQTPHLEIPIITMTKTRKMRGYGSALPPRSTALPLTRGRRCVERAADALNRTGIYPQTGPQSCAPPLCALAGSEPHGFGVPARVLWATSGAVLPRLGPRSATPSSTRPLFVPASLTEPKATEFPPLPDGALGSLAGAVLPVFLTLRPLESAGSCSGARSKAIADSMSAPARQPSAAVALTRSHKRRNHVLAEERDGVGAVNGRERAAGLVGFGPSRMTVTEGIKWSSISRRMSISHCSARSAPFLASVRSASRRRTLSSFSRRMRSIRFFASVSTPATRASASILTRSMRLSASALTWSIPRVA